MTAHDPMCSKDLRLTLGTQMLCDCALIARVRADERERIADLLQMKFSMTSARSHDGCVCHLCAINSTVDAAVDWLRGGDCELVVRAIGAWDDLVTREDDPWKP